MFYGNEKAKLMKENIWWRQRSQTTVLKATGKRMEKMCMSSTRHNKRIQGKDVVGSVLKRSTCVWELYLDLTHELERLHAAGVKFSARVLLQHARKMLEDEQKQRIPSWLERQGEGYL